MDIRCFLGNHQWNGCKCEKCGKTRNEQHNWSADCEKCKVCGFIRENTHNVGHDWSLDCEKCKKCGKTREQHHDWIKLNNDCTQCAICGRSQIKKDVLEVLQKNGEIEIRNINDLYHIAFPKDWISNTSENELTIIPRERFTYYRGGFSYSPVPKIFVEAGVLLPKEFITLSPKEIYSYQIKQLSKLSNYEFVSDTEIKIASGQIAYCHVYNWVDVEATLQSLDAFIFHGRNFFVIRCKGIQGVFESTVQIPYDIKSKNVYPLKQYTFAHQEQTFIAIVQSFSIKREVTEIEF